MRMKGIKIKVWDTVRECMYKPQGITFDVQSLAPFAVKISGRSWEPVGKFELLQWTGLCDIDENDIYEGDLIEISSVIYKVAWNKAAACFYLTKPGSTVIRSINDAASGYIVGNKFESSGLC
jgi:hypothetical protein